MQHHLSTIRKAMAATAQANGLPEFYKNDLELDFDALEKFDGHNFVWLLRTCGTVLVPIGIGVDPVFVTHWLESNHGQQIRHFYIDTNPRANTIVRGITGEEAMLLARHAPKVLFGDDPREHVWEVNAVLDRGYRLGLWGTKTPGTAESIGNWHDWQRHFESSGNRLMIDFMRKALRTVRRAAA